jgi:hypothetical protein
MARHQVFQRAPDLDALSLKSGRCPLSTPGCPNLTNQRLEAGHWATVSTPHELAGTLADLGELP